MPHKQITLDTPEQSNDGVPTWDLVRIVEHVPGVNQYTVKWSVGRMNGDTWEESIGRRQRQLVIDNQGYRATGVPSFIVQFYRKDLADAWANQVSGKTEAEIEAYALGLLQELNLVGPGAIGDI